jgi:hypothetical protein
MEFEIIIQKKGLNFFFFWFSWALVSRNGLLELLDDYLLPTVMSSPLMVYPRSEIYPANSLPTMLTLYPRSTPYPRSTLYLWSVSR